MDSKKLKNFYCMAQQLARYLLQNADSRRSRNRIGWQNIVKPICVSRGKMISVPWFTKKFPGLDDLVFTFSQLHNMPTPLEENRYDCSNRQKKSLLL